MDYKLYSPYLSEDVYSPIETYRNAYNGHDEGNDGPWDYQGEPTYPTDGYPLDPSCPPSDDTAHVAPYYESYSYSGLRRPNDLREPTLFPAYESQTNDPGGVNQSTSAQNGDYDDSLTGQAGWIRKLSSTSDYNYLTMPSPDLVALDKKQFEDQSEYFMDVDTNLSIPSPAHPSLKDDDMLQQTRESPWSAVYNVGDWQHPPELDPQILDRVNVLSASDSSYPYSSAAPWAARSQTDIGCTAPLVAEPSLNPDALHDATPPWNYESHAEPWSPFQRDVNPSAGPGSIRIHISPPSSPSCNGRLEPTPSSSEIVNNMTDSQATRRLLSPSYSYRRYSTASSLLESGPPSPLSPTTADIPNDLVLQCEDCEAEFSGAYRRGNLGRHRRVKHASKDSKDFQCEDTSCAKVFRRKDARLKHYRKYHPWLAQAPVVERSRYGQNSLHYCTEPGCERQFDLPGDLLRHQRTHLSSSERPHKCQTCGQAFLYPKDLRRHEVIHERRHDLQGL